MKEFLSSNQRDKIERYIFYLLALFLPTQLGKHFWPEFSSVLGIRIDYLSPTVYFTDILVFLLFIFWGIRKLGESWFTKPKTKKQKIPNTKLAPLFILILLISVFTQADIWNGLYKLLKLLEMSFVAYYTAKFILEKKIMQKIISVFCIGVVFQSLLAIAQYIQQGSVGGFLYLLGERYFNASTPGIANASLNGELILRPYGTFSHPNVLAGYLLIIMTLVLFAFKNNGFQLIKKLKYVTLFLGTIALFLTMSRIAIILWILIYAYYLVKYVKKRLSILILGALVVLFFISPLGARFTKVSIADEAIIQRRILIESSVKIVKSNPYLGIGIGNFLPTLARFQNPLSLGLYLQPVHNIFLLTAAEIGLIGLGIFIWFLWNTYKKVKSQKLKAKGVLIAFGSILILGLFDHYWLTLQQGQLLFAFVLGLCWISPNSFPSPRVEKF